jgi:hypothetical protein
MKTLNNRENVKKVLINEFRDAGLGRAILDMVVELNSSRINGVSVVITLLGFTQEFIVQTSTDREKLFLVEEMANAYKLMFFKYVVEKLSKGEI